MTRVAAIDCGTNSIRLLVCDVGPQGQRDLVREVEIVRLGQGVDRTGRLDDDAVARTLAVCERYAATCREHDVAAVRFCATSAARDASNAAAFRTAVRDIVGAEVEVLSGDEEAALAYDGVARAAGSLTAPVLVADIGGGSTELIVGDHGSVRVARSLDIGSVRMTERHLHSDPPSASEVVDASSDVDAAITSSGVGLDEVATVVGVAGTCTTIAARALGLTSYDPERIHLAPLDRAAVEATCVKLLHSSVEERRTIPFMPPGRADVIGGGALIMVRLLARIGADAAITVSEHDILDGIAWSMA